MVLSDVDALLAEGAIVRVHSDRKAAEVDIAAARAHLSSASAVAPSDPLGAFSLAYDGMRKVLVAHMRANGFRARSGFGAHYQTGRYGVAALSGRGVDPALRAFDSLRALRNRSEYRGALVKEADVGVAILHARAVLDIVAKELG